MGREFCFFGSWGGGFCDGVGLGDGAGAGAAGGAGGFAYVFAGGLRTDRAKGTDFRIAGWAMACWLLQAALKAWGKLSSNKLRAEACCRVHFNRSTRVHAA